MVADPHKYNKRSSGVKGGGEIDIRGRMCGSKGGFWGGEEKSDILEHLD